MTAGDAKAGVLPDQASGLPHRLAAGCMTGTSLDALDAALVSVAGHGLEMKATFLRGRTFPLGPLARRLRALAEQEPRRAGEIAVLARDFALFHLDALRRLCCEKPRGFRRPDLVCIHGQTVFHAPPVSWQLLNPAPIAYGLKTPVVYDLRAADLACGGQGAPLTPLADWVLYGSVAEPRVIVTLGGFCNLTRLPALSLPCGFTSDGLPLGLQMVAAPWMEARLLRAAQAYESATHWHQKEPQI